MCCAFGRLRAFVGARDEICVVHKSKPTQDVAVTHRSTGVTVATLFKTSIFLLSRQSEEEEEEVSLSSSSFAVKWFCKIP